MAGDDEALKTVEANQYPQAHIGHLTSQQSQSLADFREHCQKQGYYTAASESKTGRASHDDETLLRYLRARKFEIREAFTQFKDTEDWRKENKIDELYETIDVDNYDQARRLYPQWTGRRDKRGIPVYVFEVAGLTSKKMSEYENSAAEEKKQAVGSIPPKLRRLFALYENLTKFALPLCSGIPDRPYPETPVSQSNNIVDISKVGLTTFWNLKGHMQDASQLATAHYPETLDRIFIIGAPSFFPTVWSWIKRWFDPVTVSKIFVLSAKEVQPTLTKYIDIENIPKKYGGKLDWGWGDLPSLEPAIQKQLDWSSGNSGQAGSGSFPAGPIKWKTGPDGEMVAVAVGSVKGQRREERVCSMPGGKLNIAVPPMSTLREVPPSYNSAAPNDPFGPPSTSGIHTHPADDVEYFPKSGDTPTETPPPQSRDMSPAPSSQGTGTNLPIRSKPESAAHPREGTSETRFAQQEQTLAKGKLADATPVSVDHGDGDKSTTMETATVGQAPKNVDVPEAERESSAGGQTYLGQAQAAAGSAISSTSAAITGAGSSVLSAIGLGGSKKEDATEETEAEAQPQDPEVDALPNANVEDFIRSNYATHNNMGSRPVDKVDKKSDDLQK